MSPERASWKGQEETSLVIYIPAAQRFCIKKIQNLTGFRGFSMDFQLRTYFYSSLHKCNANLHG